MKFKKHLYTWILFALFTNSYLAQSPPGIPYQAIARTTTGEPYANGALQARFSLHEQTATGTVSYAETHSLQTDEFGLFSTTFGAGAPVTGTFAAINWGLTTKYLQVEIDLGNGWIDMGTQQLMSVPYAMYAGSINNSVGNNNGCYSCPTMLSSLSLTTMSINQAVEYCSNLTESGYYNWRLPTLSEFEFLRDELNIAVPSENCWTKDFEIDGSQQFIAYYKIGTTRGAIGYDFNVITNWKTVCIR
jgi:hypothetical protein